MLVYAFPTKKGTMKAASLACEYQHASPSRWQHVSRPLRRIPRSPGKPCSAWHPAWLGTWSSTPPPLPCWHHQKHSCEPWDAVCGMSAMASEADGLSIIQRVSIVIKYSKLYKGIFPISCKGYHNLVFCDCARRFSTMRVWWCIMHEPRFWSELTLPFHKKWNKRRKWVKGIKIIH